MPANHDEYVQQLYQVCQESGLAFSYSVISDRTPKVTSLVQSAINQHIQYINSHSKSEEKSDDELEPSITAKKTMEDKLDSLEENALAACERSRLNRLTTIIPCERNWALLNSMPSCNIRPLWLPVAARMDSLPRWTGRLLTVGPSSARRCQRSDRERDRGCGRTFALLRANVGRLCFRGARHRGGIQET
jgi:hypothetical protein